MLDIKCLDNYRQNEKSNKNEEHYVQIEEMFKTENEFCPFPVKNVKKMRTFINRTSIC